MPSSVIRPLLDTLFSGFIGQGKKVDEFEKALVPWMQNRNVLTLNSGTAGLHLALRLAGVGRGDEILTSPQTCQATNQPILYAGAKPVWADINPMTGNIDPGDIEHRITAKTKAILCVHLGGNPCDLDEINDIGERHGIPVIEDAAHALGAFYKGKRIGSVSNFTMFSLQAIKHITTIDGGILTTRSEDDYKRGKLLRWYGMNREDTREMRCLADVPEYGNKWHMNDICATIGIEQLNYLDGILAKHRDNANFYNLEFDARRFKRVRRLQYSNDALSSFWLYTTLVDDRQAFVEFMKKKDIHASRVHTRNDTHTCFAESRPKTELKGVKEFDDHCVMLPVHWRVSEQDRRYIIDSIAEFDKLK